MTGRQIRAAGCLPLHRLINNMGYCRMEGDLPGDILRLCPDIKVLSWRSKSQSHWDSCQSMGFPCTTGPDESAPLGWLGLEPSWYEGDDHQSEEPEPTAVSYLVQPRPDLLEPMTSYPQMEAIFYCQTMVGRTWELPPFAAAVIVSRLKTGIFPFVVACRMLTILEWEGHK